MRAVKNKGLPKEGTTRDPGLTPRGAPTRDSTTHTVSNRRVVGLSCGCEWGMERTDVILRRPSLVGYKKTGQR